MKLNEISLKNYRNIKEMSLKPCETVNILYGNNGQGKTNLIEAIWLLTGNNSFRGSKTQELISFECENANIKALFSDSKREQKCDYSILIPPLKKKITLNSVVLKNNELIGNFFCVVFSPVHLSLIKDGPKNRRNFIDIAIAQIKPQYSDYLKQYEKILLQRNALLKNVAENVASKSELYVWDIQLAKIGTIITCYRNDYVKKLKKFVKFFYDGLSDEKENLEINYMSTVFGDDIEKINEYDEKNINFYYEKLKNMLNCDIKQGVTNLGIHRDDLSILINSHSAKAYGSQGQQRSSCIALKLAEAAILKKATKENPVMLLDDVMSELDIKRQDYILNHVKDFQVFITCCDIVNTKGLLEGKIFKINDGQIVKTEEIK